MNKKNVVIIIIIVVVLCIIPFGVRAIRLSKGEIKVPEYDTERLKNLFLESSHSIENLPTPVEFIFSEIPYTNFPEHTKHDAIILSSDKDNEAVLLIEVNLALKHSDDSTMYSSVFQTVTKTKVSCVSNKMGVVGYGLVNLYSSSTYTINDFGIPFYSTVKETINGNDVFSVPITVTPFFFNINGKKLNEEWSLTGEIPSDHRDKMKNFPLPIAKISLQKRVLFNGEEAVLITVNANEYSIDSKTPTVKSLEIDSRYYVSLRNGCVLWLEKIIKSDNKNVSTFLRGQIAQ